MGRSPPLLYDAPVATTGAWRGERINSTRPYGHGKKESALPQMGKNSTRLLHETGESLLYVHHEQRNGKKNGIGFTQPTTIKSLLAVGVSQTVRLMICTDFYADGMQAPTKRKAATLCFYFHPPVSALLPPVPAVLLLQQSKMGEEMPTRGLGSSVETHAR